MDTTTDTQTFDILSPDRISIFRDRTFVTIEEAREAFHEWKERFKEQGYYSSTRYGRIKLKHLHEYCWLVDAKTLQPV